MTSERTFIVMAVIFALIAATIVTSVGAYFWIFRKQQPAVDPVAIAAFIDSDGDGFRDIDERTIGSDPNDPRRFPGSHKKVLVARCGIDPGVLITEIMILEKELPAKGACPDQVLLAAERKYVVGNTSSRRIREGDFLLPGMIRQVPADDSPSAR